MVVAQITYQSLFKLYPKLSGMTGTAKTEVWLFTSILTLYVLKELIANIHICMFNVKFSLIISGERVLENVPSASY